MRGWKCGLWLIALSCVEPLALADQVAGEKVAPGKIKAFNAAEKYEDKNATPESDYQAGLTAYNRGELIEAQGMFERAAGHGHTGAMVSLAEILDRAGFISEAAIWYYTAANLGDAEAMYRYGSMFLDLYAHDLKDTDVRTDPVEARKWFIRAAEKGHVTATNLVAEAYVSDTMGLNPLERTDAEVLKWIKRSVDVGNPAMMDVLAGAYRDGKFGLKVDVILAEEWAAKARKARGEQEEIKKKKSNKQRIS